MGTIEAGHGIIHEDNQLIGNIRIKVILYLGYEVAKSDKASFPITQLLCNLFTPLDNKFTPMSIISTRYGDLSL